MMKKNLMTMGVVVLGFGLMALPASGLSDGFDGDAGSAPDSSKWSVSTWDNNGGATTVEQDGASNVVITTGEPPVTIAGMTAVDAVATDPGAGLFHRATFGYSSPGAAGHKYLGFKAGSGGVGAIRLGTTYGGSPNTFTLAVGNWEQPGEIFARWNTGISEEAAGDWVIEVYSGKALAYFKGNLVADTTTPEDSILGTLPSGYGWGDIVPQDPKITVFAEAVNGAVASFGLISLETVPEPTTLALLGIGGLMAARRKRA